MVTRILRRLWIVVMCTVIAGTAASLLSDRPAAYTAEATMIVPGGGSGEPGRASEAQRLAATYAAVLGQDDGVTPVVAAAVGLSRSAVEERLEVVNISGTSVVQVTYEGRSPDEAVEAIRTLVRLVTGGAPQTQTVSPGTLLPTRVAAEAEASPEPPAVPIGLVLGAAVGVLLVVTLNRAEPRIDDAADLDPVVPVPVSFVRAEPEALGALFSRWSRHVSAGDTLGIVPLLAADADVAAAVHRVLAARARSGGSPSGAPVSLPPFDGSGTPVVLAQRSLADEAAGASLDERPTAIVLVLTQGAPLRAVERAMRGISTLDTRLLWCLVVPRQHQRLRLTGRQLRGRSRGAAPAPVEAVRRDQASSSAAPSRRRSNTVESPGAPQAPESALSADR